MLQAIKYNLANLTNLNGRDARSTFWFYVLFLIIVQFAISFVVSLGFTGSMVGSAMHSATAGGSPAQIEQEVFVRIGGMMRAMMWMSVALSLAMILMVAAAFTRRLQDSGKPGWIAAVAVVLQLIALVLTVVSIEDAVRLVALQQSGQFEGMQALQKRFAVQGLFGWLPAAMVIVFGVWPSNPGANRYGPEPVGALTRD